MNKYICKIKQLDTDRINYISKIADVGNIVSNIIISRGFDKDIENFLSENELIDPFLLNDMKKAVTCLEKHIKNESRICIYGDYDVDGISSSAILYLYLIEKGVDVFVFLPNRHEDGYGLSKNAIDKLILKNIDLIITVDCGISSVDEAKYIIQNNIDLIITDHHQCHSELPKCNAVINPLIGDYPFKILCGAGVAYKLVCAMEGTKYAKKFCDIAMLGTVCDLVPLTGENRIIVKQGLKELNNNPRTSIKALIDSAGISSDQISTGQIGFTIGPRLNAVGRLGDANKAFEFLVCNDYYKCMEKSKFINECNSDRQKQESQILHTAIEMIESRIDLSKTKIIILFHESWNKGVIGIVASRLVEIYNRPVILLQEKNGICTGSCRSINGIHIFDLLNKFQNYLIKFGGHEKAAGLTLDFNYLNEFTENINQYIIKNFSDEIFIPTIEYDVKIDLNDIDLNLVYDIEKLAPMGMGNKTPLFLLENIEIQGARLIGSNNSHIKTSLVCGNYSLDAVGFSMGDRITNIRNGTKYDIIIMIEKNEWNGNIKPSIIIKDFKENIKDNILNFIYKNSNMYINNIQHLLQYRFTDNINKNNIRHMWNCDTYIKRRLKKDTMSTLIVSTIPNCSISLLKMLEKEKLLDNLDITINKPTNNSCLCICPNLSEYKIKHSRLVIYDYIPTEYLQKIIEYNPDIQIVICDNDYICNDINSFFMDIEFTRAQAVKTFSILKKIIGNGSSKEKVLSSLIKYANTTSLKTCMFYELFLDLEIIFEKDNVVYLSNVDEKKNIESSNIIKNINYLKDRIYKEIDILISKGKEK